ncbi:sigma-70 family RNA polymerase sigma factor [Actinoplanes sp. TBRC 11911]|uniref:sigma-70 family RNA polymerase sigma factor n=1 Tax=Actinoplanes sp. TBRC 11911 TaxID=2729386 RepID=UPI00145D38E6|nr:sigma-70 family RNA polymerase sigma factor [Actinoplanes sp. TBRC 11911]NMO57879.1 sigma-70 family RNA polymerase sigma factor [Actinoplanes sp. TBRC 11911]
MDTDFVTQADPYRRELLAHCYRMLGSVYDAEDLVQETYVRAWRSYDRFEGRSSMRTWLHKIATNACLNALEGRDRRPLPIGLGAPSSDPADDLVSRGEVPWLEPMPDTMLADDPASVVTGRESIRLAVVAAMQYLPARQRAVLILREVLQWPAAEVAEMLDMTVASVNSALQRARAQLQQATVDANELSEPDEADKKEMLDRFVTAFEAKDINAMISLFTKDAVWEMPPFEGWYQGPETIVRLIDTRCPAEGPGDMKLLPIRANGQYAFGLYMRYGDVYRPFNMPVLTLTPEGVSHVTAFFDERLFATFGLPESIPVS